MIYKPSHCSPSLSTISLGAESTFFECVLDSSNTGVEGYSLTVWGPDGEVIFPKALTTTSAGATMPYITTVDDLKAEFPEVVADAVNTGLNGSLLRFPFVYDKDPGVVRSVPCFLINRQPANPDSELSVEISDQEDYLSNSPQPVMNFFSFNGSNWILNGDEEHPIVIGDWGLTISGEETGDSFTVRLVASSAENLPSSMPVYVYTWHGPSVQYNCLVPCFFVETSGPTVSISNQQTYLAQSPYFMANHFVYDKSDPSNPKWILNGTQAISNLSVWGLDVSGTLSDGDSFTIRFTAQDFQGNPIFIYSGETYKWTITLYHLDNGNIPTDLDQYDTQIASGTVIGSNDGRIQAIYSDNIYADYYIQPLYIPGLDVSDGYENWTINADGISTYMWSTGVSSGGYSQVNATSVVNWALGATVVVTPATISAYNVAHPQTPVDIASYTTAIASQVIAWALTNVSNITSASSSFRAKIDEYDYSYGFIYPVKGDFALPDGLIYYDYNNPGKANAFQVYKYTNNYSEIDSDKRVRQSPYCSVPMTWVNKGEDSYGYVTVYYGAEGTADTAATSWYEAYQRGELYPFYSVAVHASTITRSVSWAEDYFEALSQGDLVLLNFQSTGGWTAQDPSDSPENGIYQISAQVDVIKSHYDQDDKKTYYTEIEITYTFKRAESANSWNSILNSAYCVANSSLNSAYLKYAGQVVTLASDLSSSIAPVLNQIALRLSEEEPEQLYNYAEGTTGVAPASLRNKIGIINYNYKPTSTDDPPVITPGRLFIRPSRDVEAGMRLIPKFYINGEANSNYLTINKTGSLNNIDAISYIEYTDPGALTTIVVPGTITNVLDDPADILQYEIKTFFAEGDENYFTVECPPALSFVVADSLTTYEPDPNTDVYSVDGRSLTVTANYDQQQFVSWRSFQYHLISSNDSWEKLKILKSYPERYNGTITVDIEGLTGTEYGQDKNYILLLQGESVSGLQFQRELKIHVNITEASIETDKSRFAVEFDTQKNCVKVQAFDLLSGQKFSVYRRDIWYSDTTQLPGASPLFTPVAVDQVVPQLGTGLVGDATFEDYNIRNNCHYDYLIVSGTQTYRDSVKTAWRGWTLSELNEQTSEIDGFDQYLVDPDNVWKFKYNVSTGDFSQLMQRNTQDTMGRFAQVFVGPKRSIGGSVNCLLGEIAHSSGQTIYSNYTRASHRYVENTWQPATGQLRNVGGYQERAKSQFSSNSEADLLAQWQNVCYSGRPKLLRDEKGQSFIVAVTSASFTPDRQMSNLPVSISFEWEQVGDSVESLLTSPISFEPHSLFLTPPVISRSGRSLSIDDPDGHVESYDIYKNNIKIASLQRTDLTTTFTLSSAEWGAGTWTITAKAISQIWGSSDFSNEVQWSVYSVTVDTGGYGTSSGANLIGQGETKQVTITPNVSCSLPASSSLSIVNADIGEYEEGTISFLNPTGAVSITAACVPWTVSIASTVTNGTYSGATQITAQGTAVSGTIIPNSLYLPPDSITVNGVSSVTYTKGTTTGTVTLSGLNVQHSEDNVEIEAICAPMVFSITTTVTNGFASPSSATVITVGESATVTVVPNTDFILPQRSDIVVTNVASWEYVGGVITLHDPFGNITIETTCPESLKFQSYGDGTCCVSGIGTFSGINLIIPSVSPDGDTVVAIEGLYGSTSLERVVIPNSVTDIDAGTFYGCTSLEEIIIPDSIEHVGNDAFVECPQLVFTTENNAKYLGNSANPRLVLVSSTTDTITSCTISADTKVIADQAFVACESLSAVTFPNDSELQVIGFDAFIDCVSLTNVIIPDSVTLIRGDAFQNCKNLDSVTMLRSTPPVIDEFVFDDTNNCPIYVPANSVTAYKIATNWSVYASRIQAIPT